MVPEQYIYVERHVQVFIDKSLRVCNCVCKKACIRLYGCVCGCLSTTYVSVVSAGEAFAVHGKPGRVQTAEGTRKSMRELNRDPCLRSGAVQHF